MASIITATVKYPAGKILDTVNGPKINVVLLLADGTEHKKWGKPDSRLKYLKKGEQVDLIQDGDTYKLADPPYKLADPPSLSPSSSPSRTDVPPERLSSPSPSSKWDDTHRAAIYQELKRRAAILTTCHAQIREQFTLPTGECAVTEATIQTYATTLYLDLKDLW